MATGAFCLTPKMLISQWSSVWVFLGVLLFHSLGGVHGYCWESGQCRTTDTEAGILECLQACRVDLSAESPVYPGNGHMQPLYENIRKYVMNHFRWNKLGKSNSSDVTHKRDDLTRESALASFPTFLQAPGSWGGDEGGDREALERQEGKRSYAMEHFRWGKPVGRKRRPVKVYPNGMEEESSESYPEEFRRDLSSWEMDYPDQRSGEDKSSEDEGQQPEEGKTDGTSYKMHHFRWNIPPKDKRYGGFMTSERNHMPLVTLFKNAILKAAFKKGQ